MFAHKNNIMPVLKRSSKEKAPKRDFLFLQVVLWYLLTEVHVAGISWTFFLPALILKNMEALIDAQIVQRSNQNNNQPVSCCKQATAQIFNLRLSSFI